MANRVTHRVPAELDGERVDKAIAVILGLSRTQARGLIDEGVTLDGTEVRASDRVAAGSLLVSPEPREAVALRPEEVGFDVLYEDDSLIVVD
ncbi:MAG: RNA pseudouridine synthase, partial [Actinomycetota bacterium]|nr:RNA pseudouridine synthase [Actinomycetota bacterium]